MCLGPAVGTLPPGVPVSGAQSGVMVPHALHLTQVQGNVAAQVLVPTLTNTFRHSRRSRKGRTPLSIGFPRGRAAAMMYKACQFFTSSTMPTWPPMRIAVRNAWSLERAVVTPRRGALASGAQSCVMMPHAIHLTQVQGNVAAQVLVPSLTNWNTRRSRKRLLTTVLTVRPQLAVVSSQRAKVAATIHQACQSITSSSMATRQIAR